MMMPANYSAIAENEMTYVCGGADIWADPMGEAQWKQFNTNMVTLIGNHYLSKFVTNMVKIGFGGNYVPGMYTGGALWSIGNTFANNYNGTVLGAAKGALNVALKFVGGAAAIYNLATASTGNKASDALTKNGF